MKVITVCGSLKHKKEMVKATEMLTLKGNCLLTPNELTRSSQDDYTEEEITMIKNQHKEKIKLSDAILVIDVNGYIGSSTKSEIEYAKSLNKEIIYYIDIIKNNLL